MGRIVIALLAAAIGATPAAAPAGHVAYTVAMPDPPSHLFEVSARIDGVGAGGVSWAFPAWTPGGYRIDDVAGRVVDLAAQDGAGRALPAAKIDVRTWRIPRGSDATVIVRYRLYADERGTPYQARLNASVAHANLVRILGYVPDRLRASASIAFEPPAGWSLACSLPAVADRPNAFQAADFDRLADGIVLASGGLWTESFEDGGARYRLVFSEKPPLSGRDAVADVHAMAREVAAVFGVTPFREYTFLYVVEAGPARGGLEHLDGTSIAIPRTIFEERETYLRFVGVSSHELAHAWNVKRMRPAGLGPFDYTKETPTRLLYVAEGFSSYYGPLAEVRSGVRTREEYFRALADGVKADADNVGIRFKSLERHSWDWWIEAGVPFFSFRTNYTRGSLVALALDLEIRKATGGARSLDDALRTLYRASAGRATGYTDRELRDALARDGAPGMDRLLDTLVAAPGTIDAGAFLANAGLEVVPDPGAPKTPRLGARTSGEGAAFPKVDWVEPGSPAARGGLQSGDELIAISGRRLRADRLAKELAAAGAGAAVTVAFLRDDALATAAIVLGESVPSKLIVRVREDATPEQKALLDAWLAPHAPR